jgi:hypothetical protein
VNAAATRRATLVVAIDDPTRPERGAAELARALAVPSGIALDVVALPAEGDRRALVEARVVRRDADLVVLDVHGGGFAGDRLLDEDAELVLERAAMPVLARGPSAPPPAMPRTLVVALDGNADVDGVLAVAAMWRASFGAPTLVVAAMQAAGGWPGPATRAVDGRTADAAAAAGATVEVVVVAEPEDLGATVARHPEPVVVVSASRWSGGDHWSSTTRRLIRRAPFPVLVVAR